MKVTVGPPQDDADLLGLQAEHRRTYLCSDERAEKWLAERRQDASDIRVVRRDGKVTGGLTLIPIGQWYGGRSVRMTGIGSVGIDPQERATAWLQPSRERRSRSCVRTASPCRRSTPRRSPCTGAPATSSPVHLAVSDDVLEDNNGSCVLDVSGGKGQARQGGYGKLRVDVRGLSPLYTGFLAAEELKTTGYIDGSDADLATATTIFSGPAWLADFF